MNEEKNNKEEGLEEASAQEAVLKEEVAKAPSPESAAEAAAPQAVEAEKEAGDLESRAEDSSEAEADEAESKEPGEQNALGPYNPEHKWYVVHAYSGHEHVAKNTLESRILSLEKQDLISEVLVPEETVVEIVKGQRKTSKRRFFPGYILVRMELNKESWHIIKNSPRIMGFVGDKLHPQTIPEKEIQRMTNRISEGKDKPRPKISFVEGENVRVVDGPFLNFNGVVENVNVGKSKLRVLVSIFGRSTPVELDFVQVEKI